MKIQWIRVALFTTAPNWEQYKCPSSDEWLKTCCLHTREYDSAMQMNELSILVTIQMNCKGIMWSERKLMQKITKYTISFTWNVHKAQIYRLRKHISVCRGAGVPTHTVCVCQLISCVQLFATPWTVAPPGLSVHGILLEWGAIPFSRGSSWPRDQTQVSCIAGRFFTLWATREVPTHRGELNKQLLFEATVFGAILISHFPFSYSFPLWFITGH